MKENFEGDITFETHYRYFHSGGMRDRNAVFIVLYLCEHSLVK